MSKACRCRAGTSWQGAERRGGVAPGHWTGPPGVPSAAGRHLSRGWGPGGGQGAQSVGEVGEDMPPRAELLRSFPTDRLFLQIVPTGDAPGGPVVSSLRCTGAGSTPGQGTKVPCAVHCVRPDAKKGKRADKPQRWADASVHAALLPALRLAARIPVTEFRG